MRLLSLCTIGALLFTSAAQAHSVNCTLVKEVGTGGYIHQSGPDCGLRTSPASTFKIALALMGFEDGFLTSPHSPAIDYDPAISASFQAWRQTTTPQMWLQNSTIWYSREITSRLGMDRFQAYVNAFDYGNRDVSGDAGKNNGLTHAWLTSSLKISPAEQVAFLESILQRSLPVQPTTYDKVMKTLETFETTEGAPLKGKTGTAWLPDVNGVRTGAMQGWFVGWIDHGGKTYVFARLTTDPPGTPGFASRRTKASVLADLQGLLR